MPKKNPSTMLSLPLLVGKTPAEVTIKLQSLFHSLNDIVVKLTDARNKLIEFEKNLGIATQYTKDVNEAFKELKGRDVVSLAGFKDGKAKVEKGKETKTHLKIEVLKLKTSITAMVAMKEAIKKEYEELDQAAKGFSNVIELRTKKC